MLHLCVENTEEDLENYRIGEEAVRFKCDNCGCKKLVKIKYITRMEALCDRCSRD